MVLANLAASVVFRVCAILDGLGWSRCFCCASYGVGLVLAGLSASVQFCMVLAGLAASVVFPVVFGLSWLVSLCLYSLVWF